MLTFGFLHNKGLFKNYADKMRWVDGQKNIILSVFRVKNVNVHVEVS